MKVERINKWIVLGISAIASLLVCGIEPALDVTLNDFPPETKVGEYIQDIASNQITTTVFLTNGILTVGGDSINIAEPGKWVVETNASSGTVTTNYYPAVYGNELTNYATRVKIEIVDNGDGTVVTNVSPVAYLSDIPPDDKKADKVMPIWEFLEPVSGHILSLTMNTNAPFAYWHWDAGNEDDSSLDLFYKDGSWNFSLNGNPFVSAVGDFTNMLVIVDGIKFIATNRTEVMVVYSDQLESTIAGSLKQYVAKTNLTPIAEQITEERLQTIKGIAETLRGIRQVVNGIIGIPSMTFSFTPPSQHFECVIQGADTVVPNDLVEVDWGDGNGSELVFLPTNHVYSGFTDVALTVTIKGFIKSIQGGDSRPFIFLYDYDTMGSLPSCLKKVSIDKTMPLEGVGQSAFLNCSALSGDLSFLNGYVMTMGNNCFANSGISSLNGMPSGVTTIGNSAFEGTPLTSLEGMSQSVQSIGDHTFAQSSLTTLNGISPLLVNIGNGAFYRCENLSSIEALATTSIQEIPIECFSGCTSLSSLNGLPASLIEIKDNAFFGSGLTTISQMPRQLETIYSSAFANCQALQNADFSGTVLQSIEGSIFADTYNLTSIIFPVTLTSLAYSSLSDTGGDNPLSIVFSDRDTDTITNLSEFAWGARNDGSPPSATVFIGTDGQVVSDGSGGWTANLTSTAFSLAGIPEGRYTVSLGEVEPQAAQRKAMSKRSTKREPAVLATGTYLVDWGDGSLLDSQQSHMYVFPSATNITIKILGVLDSISGRDGCPFIAFDGSTTNVFLEKVVFGDSVSIKTLGAETFINCPMLSSIVGISPSLTSLGNNCFSGCTNITTTAFLGNSEITKLPDGCFRNTGLTKDGGQFHNIIEVGDECFMGCSSLSGEMVFSPSLSSLGARAFAGCKNLSGLSFLTNSLLSTIPDGCFMDCRGLTELPSLDALSSIGMRAFEGCVNIGDFDIPDMSIVGNNAFRNAGTLATLKTDEDGFSYRLLFRCDDRTYAEVAAAFGLKDGADSMDIPSGLDPTITKIVCSNGALLFNNTETSADRRWEVVMPAIEFALQNVPAQSTFEVATTIPYEGASLVWNWGDGAVSRWITSSPGNHTYNDAGTYIIKVKGLLNRITSPSIDSGAYIRPVGNNENPYLVGYSVPEGSPLKAIGNNAFSRCPNMRLINQMPATRGRRLQSNRAPSTNRLERLSRESSIGELTYGDRAFSFSGIESLTGLPEEMASIPNGMFSYNQNLYNINTMPMGILDIGDEAFRGCASLVNLYGWPTVVGYIGAYSFADCTSLTSMLGLEASPITSIGEGAFANCIRLASLEGLSNTLTTIEAGAFSGSGINSLRAMPQSVTNIGDGAFAFCPNLSSTEGLSTNVTVIGRLTFEGCESLTDVPYIPDSVVNIREYGFVQNGNLTNVVVGANVQEIQRAAFAGSGINTEPIMDEDGNEICCTITFPYLTCDEIRNLWHTNFVSTAVTTKLVGWDGYIIYQDGEWQDRINTIRLNIEVADNTSIHLGQIETREETPFSIRWGDGEIKTNLFVGGVEHTFTKRGKYTVTLIGAFTSIGSDTFHKPFIYARNGNLFVHHATFNNNCKLSMLGDLCFYGMSEVTNIVDFLTLKSVVAEIGAGCFSGCKNLVSLEGLPSSIVAIGEEAFAGCSSLQNITALSNSLISTVACATFSNCTSLVSIEGLPQGCTNLGESVFFSNLALRTLDGVPSSLTTIGADAFGSCTSLENISSLSNTAVEVIGARAFRGCTSLVSLDGLPNNNITLGEGCFEGCSSLVSITAIKGKVYSLPPRCFHSCTSLLSLHGLPQFEFVGDECFAYCTSLREARGYSTLSNWVGIGTFEGCAALTNITFLEDNIITLSNRAFYGCIGLGELELPQQIQEICAEAIGGCTLLTNLTISDVSVKLSNNAFPYIGADAPLWHERKAVVRFPTVLTDEIKNISGFPFGVPVETTDFIGLDGFMHWDNEKWIIYRTALEMDVACNIGERIMLGSFSTPEGEPIAVDWDDGTVDYILGRGAQHIFTRSGISTIKIYGNVSTISPYNTGPFVVSYDRVNYIAGDRITEIRIPTNSALKRIGANAFLNASNLTTLAISSSSMIGVGASAFQGCSTLSNILLSASSVSSLENNAFRQTAIASLSWIPNSISNIGDYCFAQCQSLGVNGTMVEWPSSVSHVGEGMFYNCQQMSQLTLPDTCTSIHSNTLNHAASLNAYRSEDASGQLSNLHVYMRSHTCEDIRYWKVDGTLRVAFPFSTEYPNNSSHAMDITPIKFHCSNGTITYDKTATVFDGPRMRWTINDAALSMTVSNIHAGEQMTINFVDISAGDGCSWVIEGETNLIINNEYPFTYTFTTNHEECSIIAEGAISYIIGDSPEQPWISFSECGQITKAEIHAPEIGAFSFANCSNLQNIVLHSARIDDHSFLNCTSLTNASGAIRGELYADYIGTSAFEGCSSLQLETIIVTDGIGDYAFKNCSSLRGLSIRQRLASFIPTIGNYIFSGCSNLARIQFPKYRNYSFLPYSFMGIGENVQSHADTYPLMLNDGTLGNTNYYYKTVIELLNMSPTEALRQVSIQNAPPYIKFLTTQNDNLYIKEIPTTASLYSSLPELIPIHVGIQLDFVSSPTAYIFPNSYGVISPIKKDVTKITIGDKCYLPSLFAGFCEGSSTLTNVDVLLSSSIPITEIEDRAFKGCYNLQTISTSFWQHVTRIGAQAFYGCAKLAFPQGFPSCTLFGSEAFRGTDLLDSIEWMNSRAIIEAGCFSECIGLRSIKGYPHDGNHIIPEYCFAFCTNLYSFMGMPSTIEEIKEYAFLNSVVSTTNNFPINVHSIFLPDLDGNKMPTKAPLPQQDGGIVSLTNIAFVSGGDYGQSISFDLSESPYDVVVDNYKTFGYMFWLGEKKPYLSLAGIKDRHSMHYRSVDPRMFFTEGAYYLKRRNYDSHRMEYPFSAIMGPDLLTVELSIAPSDGTPSMVLSGISTNYTRGTWGDGTILNTLCNPHHAYNKHKASCFLYVAPVPQRTDNLSNISEWWNESPNVPLSIHSEGHTPFLEVTNIETPAINPYIKNIWFPEFTTNVGEYACGGLHNCETITFYSPSIPNIHSNAFPELGITCTEKTWYTHRYRSIINFPNLTIANILPKIDELGWSPTSLNQTLIGAIDGMIYAEHNEWKASDMKLQPTIRVQFKYNRHTYVGNKDLSLHHIPMIGASKLYISIDNKPMMEWDNSGSLASCLIQTEKGEPHYETHTLLLQGEIQELGQFLFPMYPNADDGMPLIITSIDCRNALFLKRISKDPFRKCKPQLSSSVEIFEDEAFAGNTAITSLTWLPPSLKKIGKNCFAGCPLIYLNGIENCSSLTTIDDFAFSKCTKLAGSKPQAILGKAVIPASVQSIGKHIFDGVGLGTEALDICFRGKKVNQIPEVDYPASEYVPSGKGRIKVYGTDGYKYTGSSTIIYQDTGL